MSDLTFWILIGTSPIWAFPVTWIVYVFATHLKKARDYKKRYDEELHLLVKIFSYPVVAVGYALDIYTNLVTMTLVLREFPKIDESEWLVTERFDRHLAGLDRLPARDRPTPARPPVWHQYSAEGRPHRTKLCWKMAKIFILPFDQEHFNSVRR